jgi:hypothetical protein
VWVAVHGLGVEHDRQVNRPGAFTETGLAVQPVHAVGPRAGANVLLTTANAGQAERLRPRPSDLPPLADRIGQLSPFHAAAWAHPEASRPLPRHGLGAMAALLGKVPHPAGRQHRQRGCLGSSPMTSQAASCASPTATIHSAGTSPISSAGAAPSRLRPCAQHIQNSTIRSGSPTRRRSTCIPDPGPGVSSMEASIGGAGVASKRPPA